MRKVEITNGFYKGKSGFFHGFFSEGSNEEGVLACAVVELEDGICVSFASNYIRFLSQPAESNILDGMAQPITTV